MKKPSISTIILILVLVIGLSLLLYPSFSNFWNDQHQTKAIAAYVEQVVQMDDNAYDEIWASAIAYNNALASGLTPRNLGDEEYAKYEQELHATGSGVMGYIDIPSIDVTLPIYHGTEDVVLQVAVGHVEWSSLPTGGENTHCVLSGHRGLPSATLFTDLDELIVGDTFILTILNETLTYEVDQILIVEPSDTEALQIQEGKDLCTLVTCTPYGVNSHRLLVRGHRVENAKYSNVKVTADAIQMEPLIIACIIVGPILLVGICLVLVGDKLKKRK